MAFLLKYHLVPFFELFLSHGVNRRAAVESLRYLVRLCEGTETELSSVRAKMAEVVEVVRHCAVEVCMRKPVSCSFSPFGVTDIHQNVPNFTLRMRIRKLILGEELYSDTAAEQRSQKRKAPEEGEASQKMESPAVDTGELNLELPLAECMRELRISDESTVDRKTFHALVGALLRKTKGSVRPAVLRDFVQQKLGIKDV